MKEARKTVSGLLTFLVMLTAFIPFIPFWSMSKGANQTGNKLSSVFFHIQETAAVDFNSFFVIFVNPAMFLFLYSLGFFLSFHHKKYLPTYLSYCIFLQVVGCLVVGFILGDFPLISFLILATVYLRFISKVD